MLDVFDQSCITSPTIQGQAISCSNGTLSGPLWAELVSDLCTKDSLVDVFKEPLLIIVQVAKKNATLAPPSAAKHPRTWQYLS